MQLRRRNMKTLMEKKWTSIARLQRKACLYPASPLRLTPMINRPTARPNSYCFYRSWTSSPETQRCNLSSINATPTSLSNRIQDPASWLPRAPPRHSLESHRDTINCIAFHPIFSSIASGSDDCTIKVWDWELGELERDDQRPHKSSIRCGLWWA